MQDRRKLGLFLNISAKVTILSSCRSGKLIYNIFYLKRLVWYLYGSGRPLDCRPSGLWRRTSRGPYKSCR